MSNLARVNIYIPERLSFEMQQFCQNYVCWFSGPYNTRKVKFSNHRPLEIWKNKIHLKTYLVEAGSNFYKTMPRRNFQHIHQQKSLLHIDIKNSIVGSLVGFQNALRVRGVGYRFDISLLKLTLQVGYSHLVFRKFPREQFLQSLMLNKKATLLKIKSFNLESLQTFFSSTRNLRKPDVYKGKGIRYQKDFIFRKEGKKKKQVNFMARLNQLIRKKRKIRKNKDKRPDLQKCPQKKATCLKVFVMTPRKPNSALRKVAWVLLSNYHRVHAYIPGMGGHTLQKHSVVLVRGGRVKDLPGMKYTIIRGKFDLKRIYDRRSAPSKYGAKKIYHRVDHRYRKYCYW